MGEVWEARDTRLGRAVAIKLLPAELAARPDRLDRFRREARALASIAHPNIVSIHGLEEDGGRPFLIMERLAGRTLDTVIPRAGLPLADLLELALPICDALAAAHEAGVVHRDLKPGNVMVTDEGRVKLLDFGLAKLTEPMMEGGEEAAGGQATVALTGEEAVIGTASYMAPEQLQGLEVDARSDLFSLGVVLFEMASGRRPFEGGSPLAIASSILKDPAPALADRRPGLPRQLGRIIAACLEKEPGRRVQSAREVRNQLGVLQREQEAGAPAAPTRRLAVAGAATLLLAAAGTAVWLVRSGRAASPVAAAAAEAAAVPRLAVLPFENLGTAADLYFADGMTEELTGRLASLGGIAVLSRTSSMQYRDSELTAAALGEELGVDFLLEGSVRWQHGDQDGSRVRVTAQLIRVADDSHLWADSYDAVLADVFAVQSSIALQVSDRLGLVLQEPELASLATRPTTDLEAYDAFLRANDYLARGQEANDEDSVRFAIGMYDEALARDPGFALARGQQAAAHAWLYFWYFDHGSGRLEAARAAALQALAVDADLTPARYALGLIHLAEGELDEAEAELVRVLAASPSHADAHEAMAHVFAGAARWEEASAMAERAMELSPRTARLACQAGGLNIPLRDWAKATAYHDRARRLAPDRPCHHYCQLEVALNRTASSAEARALLADLPSGVPVDGIPSLRYLSIETDLREGAYEPALARLAAAPEPTLRAPWFYVPTALTRGRLLGFLGRDEEAARAFETARSALEAVVRERPADWRPRISLALALAGLGRAEEALREAGAAEERLAGGRENVSYLLRDLAEIHVLLGNAGQALDLLEYLASTPSFFSAERLRADPSFAALAGQPRFDTLSTVIDRPQLLANLELHATGAAPTPHHGGPGS
jgi:TolB-like protein/Flp pilus assembly protein TadD